MERQLLLWAAMVAGTYALLLAAYLATCLVADRLARRLPGAKIQDGRDTPPAQIRRDQRQSVLSLLAIAAMFGTGQWADTALGWGFAAPTGVLGTALSLLGSMVLFDTWFYWLHRLIHTRKLYRRVHRWHHLTLTPVAWTNNSDRLVDNLFLQSYWLFAHFLIPIAPAGLLAHKLYDQVTGALGHCGCEHGGRWCWPPSPLISVTHHDQHHRFLRCNYATHFSLWDRLMGTLHPEHDAELRRNLELTAAARRAVRADVR